MKRILTILLVCYCAFGVASAQDGAPADSATVSADTSKWKKGGLGSITFNQVGLFNWAAGGFGNTTLIGNLNLFANRKWGTSFWDNSLDLAYGFIQNFTRSNAILDTEGPITKAEDRIEFNSKYGRKAFGKKFFYAGLLTFRTQFDKGFATPGAPVYISRALSPAYLIVAVGLDYKPNDQFSMFLSPVSGKVTYVGDDSLAAAGAFGVNQMDSDGNFLPGNSANLRMEFGATFRLKYKTDLLENISWETNFEAFSNYIDRPQNVDFRWSNAFVAKVNKFITVNFFTDMIYDHDVNVPLVDADGAPALSIDPNTNAPYVDANGNPVQQAGPRLQFKEIFGIGFAYKF